MILKKGAYSDSEVEIIRRDYNNPNITVIDIGKKLNRDPQMIYIKAGKLGLKKRMKNHASDGGYRCSKCGEKLIVGKNWSKKMAKRPTYRCKKCIRVYSRKQGRIKRKKVMERLGDSCVICGYKGYALQIDHIHGGGWRERNSFNSIDKFYDYLLTIPENVLREKYQVLCANCNWEKRQEGELLRY